MYARAITRTAFNRSLGRRDSYGSEEIRELHDPHRLQGYPSRGWLLKAGEVRREEGKPLKVLQCPVWVAFTFVSSHWFVSRYSRWPVLKGPLNKQEIQWGSGGASTVRFVILGHTTSQRNPRRQLLAIRPGAAQ